MRSWYRPELLVRPARAAPPAAPHPAVPEYRTPYAVHPGALPFPATPALPAPPNPIPGGVPMAPELTRCIKQLTWTPSVAAVEPVTPERIVTMGLALTYPAASTAGNVDSAPVPLQPHPEQVASGRLDGASVKDEAEANPRPTRIVPSESSNRDSRSAAATQLTGRSGRAVVHMPTRRTVNVMVVKRDYQRSRSCVERVKPPSRWPSHGPRPAHTRAVVSLDGSRCIAIIDTGADGSLVSVRILLLGAKYKPWRAHDGRITAAAQQGIAVFGRAALELRLAPVWAPPRLYRLAQCAIPCHPRR